MIIRVLEEWIKKEAANRLLLQEGLLDHFSVTPTANPVFGDYQCNAAMSLAKVLKKSPREIASILIKDIDLPEMVAKMEIAGAGFINVFLNDNWLADSVGKTLRAPSLGISDVGSGKTVVIDYSSPNIAKPMHIGHIRSTVIGNALDRMFRALGYRVVSDNHLGDWGTQFGILIMGYRHFVDKKALEESPVEELERIYVKSYNKTKEDESWLEQCRFELVKLQSGDTENIAAWKLFVSLSLAEFDKIYRRLGVRFDLVRGESFYNDMLPDVVQELEEKGLAVLSEGAVVVKLEEEKLPVCIIRKSDGGFNYATTDLATVKSRVKEFDPEKIIYVTDERQQLHFRQLFSVARRLGIMTGLEHVWFGLMRLPEGTFSTREGNVIKLEKLLDEAESRALDVVQKASPEMPLEKQREVARALGIGAVKYMDLHQNPQTLVVFTWDKALSLEGNSAPYLQYAYARISSVRDKYAERFPGMDATKSPILFTDPIERVIALKIMRFPEALLAASETYRPNILTDYLFDLAQSYSAFYQNVPFLKADEGVRESRIQLCQGVASVLKRGLNILGIDTPERV